MTVGKVIIAIGIVLVIIGLLVQYNKGLPFLGRLPGDFTFEKGNTKIYIPIATSILLSILLSLIMLIIKSLKG